jgi:pimeloyl-ACP methyl ester carboxylesterase
MTKPPIVLVHGTNAGPWTMENFSSHFSSLGYECHSPAYRHHDEPVSQAQTDALLGLSIADYVADIEQYVRTLDRIPIVIGHSLGGVIAQWIAAKGLATGAVLLNGSVIHGALPTTDEERSLGKAFMSAGPFWEGTLLPDFETMAKYGLNMLAEADQHRVFDRLGPESGRVLFELFFWMYDLNQTTNIPCETVACPLLFVSGTEDLAIPPSTSRTIAARYGDLATFHEAQGYGHYLTLEPKWREIADVCAAWLEKNGF